MPKIRIFDTEIFTGYLVGPLADAYELEFESLDPCGKQSLIKIPLALSNNSKFMVPLPAEISDSLDIAPVHLSEAKTGRRLFSTKVALGNRFYHDLGTITISAQLLLADHAHHPETKNYITTKNTYSFVITLAVAMLCLIKVLKVCWRTACRTVKVKSKPTKHTHHHNNRSPPVIRSPPQRTDSLSSLTDTDKETGSSFNSLRPPARSPAEQQLVQQQPTHLQTQHTARRLKRRHKIKKEGALNTFEDRGTLGSGNWDPFASSSW